MQLTGEARVRELVRPSDVGVPLLAEQRWDEELVRRKLAVEPCAPREAEQTPDAVAEELAVAEAVMLSRMTIRRLYRKGPPPKLGRGSMPGYRAPPAARAACASSNQRHFWHVRRLRRARQSQSKREIKIHYVATICQSKGCLVVLHEPYDFELRRPIPPVLPHHLITLGERCQRVGNRHLARLVAFEAHTLEDLTSGEPLALFNELE